VAHKKPKKITEEADELNRNRHHLRHSKYTIGKRQAHAWAAYWDEISSYGGPTEQPLAKFVEYQQSIRNAFTRSEMPERLSIPIPMHIRITHRLIMDLPIKSREAMFVWHFGDFDEVVSLLGEYKAEPQIIKDIYRRIGTVHG